MYVLKRKTYYKRVEIHLDDESIESFFAVIVLLSTDFKPTPNFNLKTVAKQARFFPAVPCN